MLTQYAYIDQPGGPEAIRWRSVELPAPGPGEVLIRHEAVGLNFIDTYHRSGLYPAEMPARLGVEAAGVIEAVGPGVDDWKPGDRAATFGPARGAYASARIVPATTLFRVPEDIDLQAAAAALLKGCTAEFLAERAARLQVGDWALVHAAAGGVGQILVQWLAANGVNVIAAVGSAAKEDVARAAGAAVVIRSDAGTVTAAVRDATGGAGVRVVYDGVGAATWETSLQSAARRGLIVSYGNASGPVSGVNLGALASHGSLFVTRPALFDYYVAPDERAAGVARLWERLRAGTVRVAIGQTYPLSEAAQAHRDLEARRTTGSTLLIP